MNTYCMVKHSGLFFWGPASLYIFALLVCDPNSYWQWHLASKAQGYDRKSYWCSLSRVKISWQINLINFKKWNMFMQLKDSDFRNTYILLKPMKYRLPEKGQNTTHWCVFQTNPLTPKLQKSDLLASYLALKRTLVFS